MTLKTLRADFQGIEKSMLEQSCVHAKRVRTASRAVKKASPFKADSPTMMQLPFFSTFQME